MTKKGSKSKDEEELRNNNVSYEKLRDELFQYRVDIQTYKRSMNMVWACVSVVVAILGFFGYNRVEALLDKVEQNANERLSQTDELLAKVDMNYLDSLRTIVEQRTLSYEEAISALEKGTRVNNDLYKKLFDGLPYNKRVDNSYDAYYPSDATNIFDIIYYTESYSLGKDGDCYVIMGEEYKYEVDDMFLVEIMPKDRNMAIYYQKFEVHNNYNKLHFNFKKFEQYKEYTLDVILLRKKGDILNGYRTVVPINIK